MPNFALIQNTPIFYNGLVTVVGSAIDPEFEIVTMDQPLLKRNVKVLCWKETSQNSYHQNGEIVGKGKNYKYSEEWVSSENGFIDSSDFHDKTYDLNQKPSLKGRTFGCNQVRVGPYSAQLGDLALALNWKKFTELFKYEDPVARVDPDGIWSYQESSNSLIRQKVPGKDTVGDLIVEYLVLNADFDSKKEV